MEIWKDIEGFEGRYQVSNLGNVRSLVRNKWRIVGSYDKTLRYRKAILDGKTYRICRLVAKTFIPNPNNLPQVNHINEITWDDRVENLEWCDQSYNNNYGSRQYRVHKKVKIHKNGYNKKSVIVDGVLYESANKASRCIKDLHPSAINRYVREGKTIYKNHKIERVN